MDNKKNYRNVDLSGQKFHRLTALHKVEGSRSKWLCQCECGNQVVLYASDLVNECNKSCGCLERDNKAKFVELSTKHGMTETVLYKKWCGMKERCFNPHYKRYDRYGGRGITVCEEWLGENGFENFAKWAYSAGYDESKHGYEQSIDRIDVNGNYCPENCKWSDQVEQVKNRSNAVLIKDIDGEELTTVQFSIKHGIPPRNLFVYRRVKKGLEAEQILKDWEKHDNKKKK